MPLQGDILFQVRTHLERGWRTNGRSERIEIGAVDTAPTLYFRGSLGEKLEDHLRQENIGYL